MMTHLFKSTQVFVKAIIGSALLVGLTVSTGQASAVTIEVKQTFRAGDSGLSTHARELLRTQLTLRSARLIKVGQRSTGRSLPVARSAKHRVSKRTSVGKHRLTANKRYHTKGRYHYVVKKGKLYRRLVRQEIKPNTARLYKVATGSSEAIERSGFASTSVLVIDQASGQTLFSKNPDAVLPIASISKLMTAMVVLDANQDMQGVITISHDDVDTLRNTRSRIPLGSTMTRETALLLSLMSSENRVANALARHYPGGLDAFVAAMNRKAADLGMSHTHFREPTGLSNNNVSTARDLSKLVTIASLYRPIREATTTAEAQVNLGGTTTVFGNTNVLVNSPDWSIGVSKTGYIQEAGRCLVMQARVASKPVAIVLLDSTHKSGRVDDALRIKRLIEAATVSTSAS